MRFGMIKEKDMSDRIMVADKKPPGDETMRLIGICRTASKTLATENGPGKGQPC